MLFVLPLWLMPLFFTSNLISAAIDLTQAEFTYQEWMTKCLSLPSYKYSHTEDPQDFEHTTILSGEAFYSTLNRFIDAHQYTDFNNDSKWLNIPAGGQVIRRYFLQADTFQPFIQKKVIPAGKRIIFKGDLHGDMISLAKFFNHLYDQNILDKDNPFVIADPDTYIIFLGDYTDRGVYGAEVLYTLMRFKIANPDKIILIRGNHEDIDINIDCTFATEIHSKFGKKESLKKTIVAMKAVKQVYNFLPVCLFLGIENAQGFTEYIQCCHGGMELGHDPQPLLRSSKASYEFLTTLCRKAQGEKYDCIKDTVDQLGLTNTNLIILENPSYSMIGYMWSDFAVDETETIDRSDRGESIYIYGKKLTQALLDRSSNKKYRVCAVMRAHQHLNEWTSLMEIMLDRHGKFPDEVGCAKLWRTDQTNKQTFWPGIVCTLMVSPDTQMGDGDAEFPALFYDYWAILKTCDTFDNWELTIHKNDSYK